MKNAIALVPAREGKKHTKECPEKWLLQGSNDNLNWIVLGIKINQVNWQKIEIRKFNHSSSKKYTYYKLDFTDGNKSVLRIYRIGFLKLI